MAKLNKDDIAAVAHLSRLELSESEKDNFTVQINKLLDAFETLQQLDTSKVEPTSHAIHVYNVFREDKVKPSLTPEDVVANGPVVADNCFIVPRVVET